jgi:hypothetical protein
MNQLVRLDSVNSVQSVVKGSGINHGVDGLHRVEGGQPEGVRLLFVNYGC